jgi:porin
MRGNCVVILNVALLVAVEFIHFLGSGSRGLRGLAIAVLLAFSLNSTAGAESSEEPAEADTQVSQESESTDPNDSEESDRLRYKDPVITIDSSAASQADRLRFNNPGSILFRLDRDRDARRKDFLFQIPGLEPWYGFKDNLAENYGFRFGASFSHLYQRASDTLPGDREEDASGYELNIHGTWTLLGRQTNSPTIAGFEVLRIDKLGTDIPPASLFTQTGSLYPTAAAFGEVETSISELWLQQIFEKRFGFRVGKLFPITAYDYFPLKNFRLDFVDANSVANLAVPLPDRGLGGFVMYRPQPKVYLRLGVHDANADVEKAGFNSLFDEGELFKIFEVGFDPGFMEAQPGGPPPGDVHVSFWHQDERDDDNVDDGWGFIVSGSQRLGRFLPFLRYGYSDSGSGGPAVLEHMVNGGVAMDGIFGQNNDRVGVGFTWAEPAAGGLDDQWAIDGFYRIQVTPEFTVGPTVQVVFDPPRNPDDDVLFVGGIRSRIAF